MNPQYMMAYCLLGLLICNILTLVAIAVGAMMAIRKITELAEQVQSTLKRVESIVREKVAPALEATQPVVERVKATTKSVSESVQSARRVVGRVEETVTTFSNPAMLITAASKGLSTPTAQVGVAGLVLGLVTRLIRARRAHAERGKREGVAAHVHEVHTVKNGHERVGAEA